MEIGFEDGSEIITLDNIEICERCKRRFPEDMRVYDSSCLSRPMYLCQECAIEEGVFELVVVQSNGEHFEIVK